MTVCLVVTQFRPDDAFAEVWRVSVPVREGGEPTGVEGLEEKLLFVWSGE